MSTAPICSTRTRVIMKMSSRIVKVKALDQGGVGEGWPSPEEPQQILCAAPSHRCF